MKSKDGRRQEEEEREKEGRRSQREDVREIGGLTRWQGKRGKKRGRRRAVGGCDGGEGGRERRKERTKEDSRWEMVVTAKKRIEGGRRK